MGIFGGKKPAFVFSDLPADPFARLLGKHLRRVQALGKKQSAFVDKYFPNDIVLLLAGSAREKMALTQRDRQEHSAAMIQSPISYWVCTLPFSTDDARGWFVQRYGGYARLLGGALASDHFRIPRCKVLVHVVYGKAEIGEWVHVTVLPADARRFGMDPILPIELLTEEERRTSGLG